MFFIIPEALKLQSHFRYNKFTYILNNDKYTFIHNLLEDTYIKT
jgi:hypothetical protein